MRHYPTTPSVLVLAASMLVPAIAHPATVTPLLESGPKASKKNLVIIGDGFTAAEQTDFAAYVKDRILDHMFQEGPLWEDQNAFNIYRIDVESQDSGVTQVGRFSNETLTPGAPPDGTRLAFTFSPVAHLPMIEETEITDPSGVVIVESAGIGTNPVGLQVKSGAAIVTGQLDRTTGVVTLTYTAGSAPPAGTFIVNYNAITVQRTTALGYRYAPHMWCYFRGEPDTETRVKNLLNTLVPGWTYYTVVLNETGGGGCTGGDNDVQTLGADWQTYAHESGHLVGGLCDEYVAFPGTHPASEPGCVNATINNCSNRSTLKWVDFLDPTTQCPNTPDTLPGLDEAETVGHWEGADYYPTGAWRPAHEGRMRWNAHPFGPVSYDHIKETLDHPYHEHNFAETYVGDFDGDGRSDLVIHNANTLELYISDGTHMVPRWVQALPLGDWTFADHDQFLVADFDGDGRDDLFAWNMVDFTVPRFGLLHAESSAPGFTTVIRYDGSLPGWGWMAATDRFYAGDFDVDGKADLYASNVALTDWPIGYFGIMRSTGTALQHVARYDDLLPGWGAMKPGDQFFIANIDGTGGKDVYVANNSDWCAGYLLSLLATSTGLVKGARHDQVIAGWANLLPGDQYLVADFEGTGREGLYVFNGTDWPMPYLGVLRSLGGGALDVPILHQGYIEGWDAMMPHDRFVVANVDGQGGTDLYGTNMLDWGQNYVGRLLAYPDGFRGAWQAGQVGKWTLADADVFHVANFNGLDGGQALDDLVVHVDPSQNEFIGLLRNNGNQLEGPVVYKKWIHHYLYHVSGYW